MIRIGVLCSGGGTNLQALLDAEASGGLGGGRISLVVSSSPKAYALERAKLAGVPTAVLSRGSYSGSEELDAALEQTLRDHGIELVVLAGYLSIVGERVLSRYEGRILNVHPSLIPAFCGPGYYGLRVHEAALRAGVKVTGATVHQVSAVVDGGEILLQKAVEALPEDTPETLQRRVMEQAEWILLPQAVRDLCIRMENSADKSGGKS